MTTESPFTSIPSGVDIAHYFWEETSRRNDTCNGINLWRDDSDYCYLWVTSMIDHDMRESYLLDIRTNTNGSETRDFLFTNFGGGGPMETQWRNKPIDFYAPSEDHADNFRAAMRWFINADEAAMENL